MGLLGWWKSRVSGGYGQGGGAPEHKPPKIHYTPNGGFWVDTEEALNHPKVKKSFEAARKLVEKHRKEQAGK